MDIINVENLPTTKNTTSNDVIFGIINGILSAIKIDDVATTDYAKLTNNPVALITTEEFDGSKLADGAYIVARKNGSRVFVTDDKGVNIGNGADLPYGTKISVYDGTAVVIFGSGTFFVDINSTNDWDMGDYCPTLSEIEDMISIIDMTDINVSQSLVKFKSIDENVLSMTMKEFAEAMMQYFQTYDEQISAKQDKIVLGDGLKWQNGKLCLDIENGDNLKYGTSTAQAEVINENEVTANE